MYQQLAGTLARTAASTGPMQGPTPEPDLWQAWEAWEEERRSRARQLFGQGRGAEVLFVNSAWTDEATAQQFAMVAMDYSLMGLYVAKEFCETAIARTIRAQGRHADLAEAKDSPFDLRGELHPTRMSASQLKTAMQEVESHVRARAAYDEARLLQEQAFVARDQEQMAYYGNRAWQARRVMRTAIAGGRSERMLTAIERYRGALHSGNPVLIRRTSAVLEELERIETFALEKYTHIAPVKDYARNPPPDTELAEGVHRAFADKLRDMMRCDDIVRVAGLPDPEDDAMMVYEVTGVRLGPGDPLSAALRGVVRRGPEAFRPVRNSRSDRSGRITSWEADLTYRGQPVGTLRLSTRSGMLHLTNLSAWRLREPIMRVRAPRPEQLRERPAA